MVGSCPTLGFLCESQVLEGKPGYEGRTTAGNAAAKDPSYIMGTVVHDLSAYHISYMYSGGGLATTLSLSQWWKWENLRYSRTSDNGPSEKRTSSLQRTHSVLRIEITIVVILKQPPRSGRFLIPDSGQDPDSQLHFSIQNCL